MTTQNMIPDTELDLNIKLLNEYFELMDIPSEKRDKMKVYDYKKMTWFDADLQFEKFSLLRDVQLTTSTSLIID